MTNDAFTRDELERAPSRFAERRTVRFHDVDAANILFYPRALEYMSDVYVALFAARGYDLPRALDAGDVGVPLAHAEADYVSPLRFGDAIEVAIVAVRLGTKSFRVGYRVTKATGGVAAVGQTVHVCIDRKRFAPIPIPDEIRRVLA